MDPAIQEAVRKYRTSLVCSKSEHECTACGDTGYVQGTKNIDGIVYTVSRECDCRKVRRAMAAIEKSGLGGLVQTRTFEAYPVKEQWQAVVKQRAEEFANDSAGKWFFIGGQDGSGKTWICTAIARRLMQRGIPVKYMLWVGMSEQLKACVNDPGEYNDLIRPLTNAEALYIDDLFKTEKNTVPTSADIRLAFEILNFRYLGGLTTIISCERGIREIMGIDSAIGGRIYERSGKYCIDVGRCTDRNMRLIDMQAAEAGG